MNAKETKQRGIEYCKKHFTNHPDYSCEQCPLSEEVCINSKGEMEIFDIQDFEEFSASFNKMIKEIYKNDNSNTVCGTDEKKEGGAGT